MPATDSLEARAVVLDDLTRSTMMATMMDAAAQSFSHSVEVDGRQFIGKSALVKGTTGQGLREHLGRTIKASEAFWVSKDMLSLAVAGAEMMPEDMPVEEHLLPAPIGWMLFQDPISVTDIRGKLLRFHAVSWATGRVQGESGTRIPGVSITWWTNKYDPVDSVNIRARAYHGPGFAALPLFTVAHMATLAFDKPIPMTVSISGPGGAVVPPEVDVQIFEKDGALTWVLPSGILTDGPETGTSFIPHDQSGEFQPTTMPAPDLRVLAVIWRLMRQTITDVSDSTERIPAHLRKTIARQNTSARVSVIALRKTVRARETGKTVEWSHRFLRRGHWRHQWYGSGETRHRVWIWIHPSLVNGAREDLPLLVREHVSALIR